MKRLPTEIEQKVRRIELRAQKFMNDWLSGAYKSRFKGHGIQFSEHMVYTPGDDVRHIDWKVSARHREPLVKRFEEERELTVFIIVDTSASLLFGSTGSQKKQMAAEIGGLLALAASITGDKVGTLFVSPKKSHLIPPKRGRNHVRRIVHEILSTHNVPGNIKFLDTFQKLDQVLKHRSIVFLVSDFIETDLYKEAATSLSRLCQKHDVITIQTSDPTENHPSLSGWLPLVSAETSAFSEVSSESFRFSHWLKETSQKQKTQIQNFMKKNKAAYLDLNTQEDYVEVLARYFEHRRR